MLVALLLAAFLVNLDTTLVNVALPALTRDLHATTTQLQWVVDAYNLVFAALLLTFGSLSDRFGRKGMLLAGLAVVGAASLAGGFTTSASQLIAARAVMGLGAAMTFPATLSLLTNVFTERRERARAIGLWGAIAGVAIALGPIVGGWLLRSFSWGSIFIAMAPVAALALAGVAIAVPASRSPDAARPDVTGLVLSSAMMALVVFTIIEAPAHGWTSARSVAGFAVSAVLLAAFIAAERRAAHPMLDVRLFRNMRFSAASGAVTVSFFTLLGFIFLITQYFQFVRGYSALSAGVRLLPVALAVAVGSVAGTQLAVRAGTKLIVTIGLVAMAAFYGWVAATTSATLSYGVIAVQMVVYGLGMGLTSAPATEAIMGAVSRSKAGVGSAVNDATRLIGGTLGVAVIGSVYASVYGSRLTAATPADVPGQVAALAHQSVGAAYAAAGGLAGFGHPALGQALRLASTNAFLRGLTVGALVAGGVAAAGAILAAVFLPAQPQRAAEPPPAAAPAPSAEPASPRCAVGVRDGAPARGRPLGR
ncbi:DHA2 family efflux MFS transporter permease subunit [Trebonia kvetii]|uniref:DHA2 family efflux MFS transporter permease subunit n=1 Tax=Trebonia kvetii TaxID=2480626 RepID=A0A6P2C8Q6_9ACTN|nr:DHA2 family efflux MFS transporter permease subunit [Trebonia kvetii]